MMNLELENLKKKLTQLASEFSATLNSKIPEPGKDYIPPSGKVVGASEFIGAAHAAADLWLTAGSACEAFEAEFPKRWGLSKCLLVNSGSSANLIAFSALTSPKLKDRQLKPGDEFITPACGFPTTVAPAIQHGLKPIFIDVDSKTHNALTKNVEEAITPKTKLIMMAHALGNPFRADEIKKIADKHNIWLIEDCCDALGATIDEQHVGTWGDLSTCSFYPAHHITMGEGGAVLSNQAYLHKIAMSFRDWGRDCWCPPGVSNSCGVRFDRQMGCLPKGYDHKYIYSHLGYNLKTTDFQAGVGLAQLERLSGFIDIRRQNHSYLTKCLLELGMDNHFLLPERTPGTNPSWFGYFLTLKESGSRSKILPFLEKHKVGTRLLFAGNLLKQPAFEFVKYEVCGSLENTDKIMNDGFWVGIWPGLSKPHMEYIAETIAKSVKL